MGAVVGKPKIVLLGQKDPHKEIELSPDEGPFESWLAVAQDMWGLGNLTPLDSVFASRAIGTIVPTVGGNFGCVCYQLGDRLFTFSREAGIWIDSFEGENALSRLSKRPKDKIKIAAFDQGKKQLGNNRLTHLAVLAPSKLQADPKTLAGDAAAALKKEGQLFLADIMCGPNGKPVPGRCRVEDYKAWLTDAGLKFYSEVDLTADVRVTLLRGLYNSINMAANVRHLQEPWKGQRFKAFEKELAAVVGTYKSFESGFAAAIGLYFTKP
jgi:hypothetical protein